MAEKIGLDASEMARLEGLLSDALTHEGNDSVWAYKWDDGRVVVGTFRMARLVGNWGLFNQSGVAEMVDDYESLFKDLHNGDLTLVSPPSVSAPEVQPIASTEAVNQPKESDYLLLVDALKTICQDSYRPDPHHKPNDFEPMLRTTMKRIAKEALEKTGNA